MTNTEFSSEFDILYNNITSNASPGLNEYEKSVLLTKAQEEILKNYYNANGNKYKEGFDDSSKRQLDFSNLITTQTFDVLNDEGVLGTVVPLDPRAVSIELPHTQVASKILFILNEAVSLTYVSNDTAKQSLAQVIPLSKEEYFRAMNKPYKYPLKNQVWRLLSTTSEGFQVAELIARYSTETNNGIYDYTIRYIRKPNPILLVNLTGDYQGLKIDGYISSQECELDPIIHREILDRAVELAKISYMGDTNTLIQTNTRNE